MKATYLLPFLAKFTLSNVDASGTSPEIGPGPGPGGEDVFRQANMSPNATGTVNLFATNMSLDTNTGETTIWRAHLNITEVRDLNYTPSPSADVITNSVIGIDTLGTWVENSDWDTKIIIFTDVARNATVDGQKDAGDCYVALGEKCVKDYSVSISASILAQEALTTNTNTTSIIPLPPASCGYKLSNASIMSPFDSKLADGSAYIYRSSPAHSESNTTYYQEATTRIWPILVMQNGKNGTGIAAIQMSCLRANATTKGSNAIGSVPGASGSNKASSWAVIGAVCLVGALLI